MEWKLITPVCCMILMSLPVSVDAQSDNFQSGYVWRTRLLDDLFRNYHRDAPPIDDGAFNVGVELKVTSFDFIDEANGYASLHGWLSQNWIDPRLKWNPEDYNNTKSMIINADKIWLPDIEMFNSGTVSRLFDTDVYVDGESGFCYTFPSLEIKFICPMDFKFFPYDKQVCTLKFGSWHHSVEVLNLTEAGSFSLESITKFYRPSNDFKLADASSKVNVVRYDCCSEAYADIEYELHLTRISGAYSAKLVLPAVLTGFLLLVTFLLPPASFEKITLCGLIFVAILLQLTYLHDIVPMSGDTILGEYLAFIMFLDFLATVLAAVSYQVHVRSRQTQQHTNSSIVMTDMEGDDGDLRLKVPIDRKREFLRYIDFAFFFIFGVVFIVGLAIILGRRG